MNRPMSVWVCLAALMSVLTCSQGFAQQGAAGAAPAAKPAAEKRAVPTTKSPYRQLAPGVLVTIDPMRELKETVDRHDVVELLAVDPKFELSLYNVLRAALQPVLTHHHGPQLA